VFPDGHGVIVLVEGRLLNLGATTGHPAFVMSCILCCHAVALLDLWERRGDGKYARGRVKALPRGLDERVAALHLPALGARLTRLTAAQAAYISVPVDGPYKAAQYRY
jgi:adenosylhomocysteinase